MFLSLLKEENKRDFLKVCVHAALANGMFEEEEKEMLDAYSREMNVAEDISSTDEPLEDLLQVIANNASEMEKNIIVLEILGLVKADGIYDDKEKTFMKELVNGIGVKQEFLGRLENLLDSYTDICKELYRVVTE